MKIIINNPRIISLGNKLIIKTQGSAEQMINLIEKALLKSSILVDSIEIKKESLC